MFIQKGMDLFMVMSQVYLVHALQILVRQYLFIFTYKYLILFQNFMLKDATGEEVKQAIVAGITQEQQGLVSTHEDKRHGFMDGDYVTFREVEGMSQVNE